MEIQIKYFTDKIERLRYIDGKSDWIDLRAARTCSLRPENSRLIPLGVAMQLPAGYEAHIVPRKLDLQAVRHLADQQHGRHRRELLRRHRPVVLPGLRRARHRHPHERPHLPVPHHGHQPALTFREAARLTRPDRGGHGSTGRA